MARRVVPTAFPTDPQLTTPDELGAAVRAARTAGGLTLEEAALAVSVAKQTLGDLEAGKPTVGLGIALRVAKVLGASLFIAPAGDAGAIVQRFREARYAFGPTLPREVDEAMTEERHSALVHQLFESVLRSSAADAASCSVRRRHQPSRHR